MHYGTEESKGVAITWPTRARPAIYEGPHLNGGQDRPSSSRFSTTLRHNVPKTKHARQYSQWCIIVSPCKMQWGPEENGADLLQGWASHRHRGRQILCRNRPDKRDKKNNIQRKWPQACVSALQDWRKKYKCCNVLAGYIAIKDIISAKKKRLFATHIAIL